MKQEKNSFSGRLGFVLATAGSAVGLGNIWRFPYLAAKYGGGIFLVVYLILALTFGFTLILAETTLGRKTGKGPIGTFMGLTDNKTMRVGGYLNAIIPMLILPYYCVIGGWVIKYLLEFGKNNLGGLVTDGYFSSYIAKPVEPVIWFMVFIVLTFLVVLMGVEKGIEKISKILMPILLVLAIFIVCFSVTRPGAMEGVKYYLVPDFSKFSLKTIAAAMGQLFYSLSIGMGILYTYGSYMKREVDIEKSIKQVEIVDTIIALLAGLMIIPAVFAFSSNVGEHLNAGPGLMFVTMPQVFNSMSFGGLIGFVFFLLVLVAALTSAISLMETCVSTLCQQKKWSRLKSCMIMLVVSLILGIPSSLGFGVLKYIKILGMDILDFFDFATNKIMMPISATFTCVLVVYFVKVDAFSKEIRQSSKFTREKLFNFCIKYVAPVCLLIIMVTSILDALGLLKF